jgi:outer membrane protein assembly factor BamB
MRRPTLLLVALAGMAAPAAAQKQPLPVAQPGGVVTPDQKRTDNGLFTIPEQRDAREQLKAVMDYLARTSVPWDVVTSTAQRLLDAPSDSFYRVKDAKGEDTGAVVSVKSKVNSLLAELPKEGKQFYEQEFGPRATELLKKAVADGYDRAALSDISQRLYQTKAGAQATLLLAAVDLDAGRYGEAAYGFQRLLSRDDGADTLTPRVLFKAAVAFKRAGDARQAEAVAKLWDRLEKGFPRGGLLVGRKSYSLEELRAELDRPFDLGGNRATERFVSTRLGNAAHAGTAVGGTPFLDPVFVKPLLLRREGLERQGADWVAQSVEGALKRLDAGKSEVSLPGFFPVTAEGKVIYRGYDGVYAVASRDGLVWQGKARAPGELLWIAEALGGAQAIMSAEGSDAPLGWWNAFWGQRNPGVLFENAQLGSLSHDGRLVYYVDDLAIPPPPIVNNPNMGFQQQVATAGVVGKVAEMQNFSRLHAIDLDTGKLSWTLGGPETATLTDEQEAKSTNTQLLTENSFFLGPPLAVDGRLYVLYERKSQVRVACLDPSHIVSAALPGSTRLYHYPELLWTQSLGEASTSLKADTLRRVQPAYLAYADGVLVCPTNCGVVVALDVNARRLLWARYYGSATDQTAVPGNGAAIIGGGRRVIIRGGRAIPQPSQPVPTERWRAAAPIIAGGKVVLTAYDSDLLQCLDLRTGTAEWAVPRQSDDLYVAGVEAGRVVVVGKKSVHAFTLAGVAGKAEKVAWNAVATGTPCGHGVMGKGGVYYLPMLGTPEKPEALEPQVWALDTATGAVLSRTEFRRRADSGTDARLLLGNLLFQDGQLFSQSALELSGFPLLELKRREMVDRLKANPADPEGLFARGELALDAGDVTTAIADFQAARAHNPPESLRRRMREKFYLAYTDLLRTDFAAGEKYLDEYAALCEVPVDTDVAAERQRLLDEQLRRKALYLTILARGRERQGKLGEAFDAYRAFAALGGNRQLVTVAGEPDAETRPDVWARGRIDAMIRTAKDPAARAALEGRVRKEWEALKAGNDMPRLREFARLFGAFFPAGREAQLTLAERLLATNGEEDQREAQSLLLQLWSTAADPAVAARAVERLARLMTDRGQVEDAVGLYAQLARRFADVPVRDGKTGAQVYAELVTDRRLLPFLEPGGVAGMAKYKAETATVPMARASAQGFSIHPTGDLFPFYRRFQLALELSQSGDNSWSLRVADRATGEERCKFTGLSALTMGQNYGNRGTGNLANSKAAQANGQLVLLTMGQYAYCFDLAERRELWRQNLLGKNPPGGTVQATEEADGEVVFRYEDGWTFRMARSAVLQQSYVALVTRDGLKAVDPLTGQDLWVRTNLSPKVQIFGDERHIFVLDNGTSKVFRAIDGVQVAGIPDFVKEVGKPGTSSFVGRLIFHHGKADDALAFALYDPLTGKDVWRREFPGKPQVLRTVDPAVSGVLMPDGSFEAFSVETGKTLARGQVDANQVATAVARPSGSFLATEPLLLLDAERIYLVLSKAPDGGNSGRVWYGNQGSMLETLPVNGPVYAFDRATGKRLWYNNDSFKNQKIVLDRFDELPALVAANVVYSDGARQPRYAVVAIDKKTGRLRHDYAYSMNGGEFANAARDPKTRGVEFWRGDGLRLTFTPDE